MENEKVTIGLKVSRREKELLEILAKDKGLDLSKLLRKAAWFFWGIDDDEMNHIQNVATALNVKEEKVVSVLLKYSRAMEAAYEKVYGFSGAKLPMFLFSEDGNLITGQYLYEFFEENFTRQFKLQMTEQEDKRPKTSERGKK